MRWITYAVCLCVVVIQLNHAMPTPDEAQEVGRETLQTIDKELGKPTAESSIREKRTVGVFRRIFPEISKEKVEEGARENALPEEAASEVKEVRVPYVPPQSENDLQAAATGGDNEEAETSQEEVSDDIDISETEENSRSKRLGVFGNLLGGFGGNGGSSGGGSGNFLFDIIRRTADGAARAAGSVYRLVAGTDDLGLTGYDNDLIVPTGMPSRSNTTSTPRPSTTTTTSTTTAATLVAGSGATEQQDENANSPLAPTGSDQPLPADDGYQAGIPGPITRLFVIANRGIANLMQDLILRLAQTSERIVNFKARLITAII